MTGPNAQRETALGRKVRGELGAHLARTSGPGDGVPVVVDVVVTVQWVLSDPAEADLEASLAEQAKDFPGTIARLVVKLDQELPEPGYTVAVVPVAVTTGEQPSAPVTEDEPDESQDEDQMVFALRLGRFRFHELLRPSAGWVPVSRQGPAGIVFPDEAEAVPRAAVLEVRNTLGALHVRRTRNGRDYVVSVGGRRLEHGKSAGVGVSPTGKIVIREATGDAVVSIEYELHDRFSELRTGGGPADPGDQQDITAWVTGGHTYTRVRVHAPQPGHVPSPREFTEKSDQGELRQLRVSVRYTTAESMDSSGDSQWHVKVYRCDFPADAQRLRKLLDKQIGAVERVNGKVGGSNRMPPWAIAPVHVLALERPAQPETNLADAGEHIPEGVEARLAAWFGVPDQPQPGCCVLVASPLVDAVGWLGHELRRVPGRGPLDDLRKLARRIDLMHSIKFAHGDIKPDNVRRLARADEHDGYLLIDADSIGDVHCEAALARPTDEYTSADYREQKSKGDFVDLRALDRFGFLLVTIAAVASPDRLRTLLERRGAETRVIDSHQRTMENLVEGWPRWEDFARELASPLAPRVLADPKWSLEAWVERLIAAHDQPGPSCGHRGCPEDACVQVNAQQDDVYDAPHSERLKSIRDNVRDRRHMGSVRDAVVRQLVAEQRAIAQSAFWLAFRSTALAVVGLVVIVLVSLKVGGVL